MHTNKLEVKTYQQTFFVLAIKCYGHAIVITVENEWKGERKGTKQRGRKEQRKNSRGRNNGKEGEKRVLMLTVEWWTLRLRDTSPTGQFAYCLVIRLLDTSPTGHFAYETFRLQDSSPIGQFAY